MGDGAMKEDMIEGLVMKSAILELLKARKEADLYGIYLNWITESNE